MHHHEAVRTAIAYTDRLDEIDAAPSIGTIGDSFDNAMAESVIGLFKTELHRNPAALARNRGPWRGLDDLEIATCGWVSWFNDERFHGELDASPPPKSKPTTVTDLRPQRHEKPTHRVSGRPRPIQTTFAGHVTMRPNPSVTTKTTKLTTSATNAIGTDT